MPVAVAFAERVIVFAVNAVTVVPTGMPAPEIPMPSTTPAVEPTEAIDVEPLVVLPVVVIVVIEFIVRVTVPEAVAFAERVIVFAVNAKTVTPAGIPVPEIFIPTTTPAVEATEVIEGEEAAVVPVVVIVVPESPNVIVLPPSAMLPCVIASVPPIKRFVPRLIPFELLILIVELAFVVIVPDPLIDCGANPLRFTVPTEAGAKFNVCPERTEILPLIECPAVPIILKFKVPEVIVRLFIETGEPPVTVHGANVLFISTSAYVRLEKDGVPFTVAWCE